MYSISINTHSFPWLNSLALVWYHTMRKEALEVKVEHLFAMIASPIIIKKKKEKRKKGKKLFSSAPLSSKPFQTFGLKHALDIWWFPSLSWRDALFFRTRPYLRCIFFSLWIIYIYIYIYKHWVFNCLIIIMIRPK